MASRFDKSLEHFFEYFSASTPIGYSILAERVHRVYYMPICYRDTIAYLVDLVEMHPRFSYLRLAFDITHEREIMSLKV